MSKFTWWGKPAPTWRTPLQWLRFKLFRIRFASQVKAKRSARAARITDMDWDRSMREANR